MRRRILRRLQAWDAEQTALSALDNEPILSGVACKPAMWSGAAQRVYEAVCASTVLTDTDRLWFGRIVGIVGCTDTADALQLARGMVEDDVSVEDEQKQGAPRHMTVEERIAYEDSAQERLRRRRQSRTRRRELRAAERAEEAAV